MKQDQSCLNLKEDILMPADLLHPLLYLTPFHTLEKPVRVVAFQTFSVLDRLCLETIP